MSDILSRLEMAVAENNTAAIINIVKGELMDAVGKTIFETPVSVGNAVSCVTMDDEVKDYIIEKISIKFQLRTKDYQTVYDEDHKFYGRCWAGLEQWNKTIFLTEQTAADALGGKNERP
jgi:hypothetical protein